VKPSEVTYTVMGDNGLNPSITTSKEEADIMGYSFSPASASQDEGELQPEGLETNNDDNTSYEGSPEMTDMSSPHSLVSSSTNSSREWLMGGSTGSGGNEGNEGNREWLMDRTAGRQYTQWEQREFIDEDGNARNAEKLDLAGTHYEAAYDDDATEDQFLFGW
jgi:hypothetical protein